MRSFLTFFLLSVFMCLKLYGQITPYEPNSFANLDPVWQHLASDSSTIEIDENKFNGINHFAIYMNQPGPFLILEDFLYIGLNTTIQMRTLNEGGYVEKIDLETGQSIWKDHFDLRDSNHKEFVESLSLDENGRLKVITTRDIKPTYPEDYNRIGSSAVGDSAMISIRLYDTLSGQLIDHIVNEYIPDSTQWIYYEIANNTLLKPSLDDSYYFNRYDYFSNAYYQYNINENGRILDDIRCDSITFDLPFDSSITSQEYRNKMFRVSDDTLLTLDYLINIETESVDQVKLTLYDKNFQKRKIIPLDSVLQFNYRTLRLSTVDKSYIYLFGMIPGPIPHTSIDDTMAHCILNWDGIPEYQFKNLFEGNRLGVFPLCYLEREKEFLLVDRSSDPAGFDLFKTNKDAASGFELLKRIYYNNPKYVFSVRELYQLENGDILLYGLNKTKPDWSNNYIGNWQTFIRIPAEELGLKTSINNAKIVLKNRPLVYPNPAQNTVNIAFKNEFSGMVQLFDVLGNIVLIEESKNTKYLNLDICNFSSGIYIVHTIDETGIVKYDNTNFIKK